MFRFVVILGSGSCSCTGTDLVVGVIIGRVSLLLVRLLPLLLALASERVSVIWFVVVVCVVVVFAFCSLALFCILQARRHRN